MNIESARNIIKEQVSKSIRHLLSEENLDPCAVTMGCFDRRFWAWKTIDFPEATFQRNVYPLAWFLEQIRDNDPIIARALTVAILAGLEYTTKIQHDDGSFDQAFPNEHSFGATAFLIHPLARAYQVVMDDAPESLHRAVEKCLRKGADFLCKYDEKHGHISNHLAGAALSLMTCAVFFGDSRYMDRAKELQRHIIDGYSREGWFLEYEGADPGYQTLCLYYLAQIYLQSHDAKLLEILSNCTEFLSYFVHPDGSFAGEYGSRRTAIYYAGGLALLHSVIPMAARITQYMAISLAEGNTITIEDIDMGNIAPVLSNYLTLLDMLDDNDLSRNDLPRLPFESGKVSVDFAGAGLYLRGNENYYAVFGVSNGGVLKVFDVPQKRIVWDDGGYIAESLDGKKFTTQITGTDRQIHVTNDQISVTGSFHKMPGLKLSVFYFVLLRILNMTMMRNIWIGNFIKRVIVNVLIRKKQRIRLELDRTVLFGPKNVTVNDRLRLGDKLNICRLEFGRPFVAVHMASAGYFKGYPVSDVSLSSISLDTTVLNSNGDLTYQVTI